MPFLPFAAFFGAAFGAAFLAAGLAARAVLAALFFRAAFTGAAARARAGFAASFASARERAAFAGAGAGFAPFFGSSFFAALAGGAAGAFAPFFGSSFAGGALATAFFGSSFTGAGFASWWAINGAAGSAPVITHAAPAPAPEEPTITFPESMDVKGALKVGSTLVLKNYKALLSRSATTAEPLVGLVAGMTGSLQVVLQSCSWPAVAQLLWVSTAAGWVALRPEESDGESLIELCPVDVRDLGPELARLLAGVSV